LDKSARRHGGEDGWYVTAPNSILHLLLPISVPDGCVAPPPKGDDGLHSGRSTGTMQLIDRKTGNRGTEWERTV
jgi:hypothetical protein